MININSNTDSKVILFLEETFDYYLFVFSRKNGCESYSNIYTAVECDFYTFILNENLDEGFWDIKVYGQSDYSNLHPELATFLFEDSLRVDFIFDYIITESCENLLTENNINLIT
jgi:hypothetical protein